MNGKDIAGIFARVRANRPLVHHITNIVTINDCANITISAGAAPVMTSDKAEAAEMVSAANALVLNIGTLTSFQVESMLEAGKRANELGIPVILDPVGAGATKLRTQTVMELIDRIDIAVIMGNAGEIGTIAGIEGGVRGVDSCGVLSDPEETVRACAESLNTTVVMSGPVDIISDGKKVMLVENGVSMMGNLSGTGCMGASLTGAFAAVEKDYAISSTAAFATFGRAGELAAVKSKGPYSFRTALFDELSSLNEADLAEHAKVRAKDAV
ncbi:hydroxyethylthiazole kinase [Methanolacinia petrolearia]|uniref:hydroxyethylthiazole kinase n=1 Tax=Methanolacinia petrolearia TaxID=54120 RepID=UPI003BACF82F